MCNLKYSSQLFRFLIGLVMVLSAWFGPQTSLLNIEWMHLWNFGWLGFIPLLSGIAAFCPVYAVLGFGHQQK
ncbi:MAG: DUF2892 domain-containing protein [Gammaproteobacteria bacterium]|jgi:hypothetical protein|nr:DUF2892 domain-containing protein [Gammaproteobacteria bacterium]